MALRAGANLRSQTDKGAASSDEIDAGWGETTPAPESSWRKQSPTRSASSSLPPVSTAPRVTASVTRGLTANRSWMARAEQLEKQLGVSARPSARVRRASEPRTDPAALAREEPTLARKEPRLTHDEPTLVREEPTLVRDELTLIREEPTLIREEPTLEISTQYLDETDIDADEGVANEVVVHKVVEDALVADSALDLPNFRPHRLRRNLAVLLLGALAAVAILGVASGRFTSSAEPPAPLGTMFVPNEPIPRPLPALQRPEPEAKSAAPAVDAPKIETASAPPPVAPALEQASNTVAVTVKVIPEHAVIFRAGKKLGTGEIQVDVERPMKQRLTALHDGYVPYNFTLDGSRDKVTVRLTRVTKPPPASGTADDSPAGEPEAESTSAPSAP